MNSALTIQEKLKDLRVEKGLSLEELAKETGISKSALGSYESNDYKDISHTSIIALAKFYGVTSDYLLGITENIEEGGTVISDLKLDDETINIIKSGEINNRLLCEIIKHPDFWKFMSDVEIYVDSIAEMQMRNINSLITILRTNIKVNNDVSDRELYLRTLKTCEVDETDYFDRLIFEDIKAITKDIKANHSKDRLSGDKNNPLDEVMKIIMDAVKLGKDPTEVVMKTITRQLRMNLNKMDKEDIETFTNLVKKYSGVYKDQKIKYGRGRKSKKK